MLTWNDEYLNDMAIGWYFLCINVAIQPCMSRLVLDDVIEYEEQLKNKLKSGGYTFLKPLNIFLDTDSSFDIWLDADWDIQASELYSENDLHLIH